MFQCIALAASTWFLDCMKEDWVAVFVDDAIKLVHLLSYLSKDSKCYRANDPRSVLLFGLRTKRIGKTVT